MRANPKAQNPKFATGCGAAVFEPGLRKTLPDAPAVKCSALQRQIFSAVDFQPVLGKAIAAPI